MSSATLYRLGGIALLIGSVLIIVGNIPDFFLNDQTSALSVASSAIRLVGAMLVALGLPGRYARFAGRAGVLGLIGFTGTFFFFLAGVASEAIVIFIFPVLAAHGLLNGAPPLGLLVLSLADSLLALVGGVLLGIALMRAAVLTRWAGIALIVGSLLFALGSVLDLPITGGGLIIFAVVLAWLAVGVAKQPAEVKAPQSPGAVRA